MIVVEIIMIITMLLLGISAAATDIRDGLV